MTDRQWGRGYFVVAIALALSLALALPGGAKAQDASPERNDLTGFLRIASLDDQRVSTLAREYDLSTLSVMAANFGLSQFWPETREQVVLPTAHILPKGIRDGILIDVADFRLYYFRSGKLVLSAPIGVGEPGLETPLGKTTVVRKKVHPAWYPTPQARAEHPDWPAVVPPGPDNPMGQFAMYLGWQYMAIHGSNDDFGIGRPYTRGCVRLFPEDIETLFQLTPLGTRVEVVDERVKLGWHRGELFLEAHPDIDQLADLGVQNYFTLKEPEDFKEQISAEAGERVSDVDWQVVATALKRRSGLPTQITSPDSHPVSIFEPKIAMSEMLKAIMETNKAFAPKAPPPEAAERPSPEELMREHRFKFPYNI